MVNKELEQWVSAIVQEDGHNLSAGSLKTLKLIREAGATQSSTVKGLKEKLTKEIIYLEDSLNKRDTTVKELEREVADLKDALAQTTKGYEIMRDKRFEAEREVERLKGLVAQLEKDIDKAFIDGQNSIGNSMRW